MVLYDRDAQPVVKGHFLVPVVTILLVLTTISVALRIYSRTKILKSFGWDDWLIIPAWIFAIALNIICSLSVKYGWGKHIYDVSHEDNILNTALSWGVMFTFTVATGITKMSILLFYTRFYDTEKRGLKIGVWIAFALSTLWTLSFVIVCFTQCTPLSAYWLLDSEQKEATEACIRGTGPLVIYVVHSVSNFLLDCLVFCLPIPTIMKLTIPLRERIVLSCLMAVGLLVCVISFFRTVALYEVAVHNDQNWYGYDLYILVCAETDIGILCASIPATKPLLLKILPQVLRDSRYSRSRQQEISLNQVENSADGRHMQSRSNTSTDGSQKNSMHEHV